MREIAWHWLRFVFWAAALTMEGLIRARFVPCYKGMTWQQSRAEMFRRLAMVTDALELDPMTARYEGYARGGPHGTGSG